ncbi:MAG: NAD(P)/FAD-dependent oxidoreductase [Cyanothece sp. SIO1E1]|nr:NAD(P)/FAD-dependent oxidoreductase [Cyanothece sp. SIO1E1]
MAVDYDLVIIGGTVEARYAAIAAARLHARVALVEPTAECSAQRQSQVWNQTLIQVGQVAQQMRQVEALGLQWPASSSVESDPCHPLTVQWQTSLQRAQLAGSILDEARSPAILAAQGVDVIWGEGQFCHRPRLSFTVDQRRLTACAYLIATGASPVIPNLTGLPTVDYLTPETLGQPNRISQLPDRLVVIGGEPAGLELGQTWARLGVQVTILVKDAQLLPYADQEAAHLIQAQLEADGVRILTNTPVSQIKQSQGQKWIQSGDQAVAADAILLAVGWQPNLQQLNLEAVGIAWSHRGIRVNQKLQTTHPRIYACGAVLGGYPFTHLAEYEASIALKNALFLPKFKVDYRGIPWAVLTTPELARVGLTEAQARQRYGKHVWVLKQHFQTIGKAQISGHTNGFCKLIAHPSGTLLGAHIIGPDASELIHSMALAIRQGLKIEAIAALPHISTTLSVICAQAAMDWHKQRLQRHSFCSDWLENWFNLHRTWFH